MRGHVISVIVTDCVRKSICDSHFNKSDEVNLNLISAFNDCNLSVDQFFDPKVTGNPHNEVQSLSPSNNPMHG